MSEEMVERSLRTVVAARGERARGMEVTREEDRRRSRGVVNCILLDD